MNCSVLVLVRQARSWLWSHLEGMGPRLPTSDQLAASHMSVSRPPLSVPGSTPVQQLCPTPKPLIARKPGSRGRTRLSTALKAWHLQSLLPAGKCRPAEQGITGLWGHKTQLLGSWCHLVVLQPFWGQTRNRWGRIRRLCRDLSTEPSAHPYPACGRNVTA